MNALPWQRPNATEAFAAESLANALGYLAFPWATWIDLARDHAPPPAPVATAPTSQPLATVGQHIEMLQHTTLLRSCGVTDLFWSHATQDLRHHQGLRIHPFPLYPVRCATHPGCLPLQQRRWLYSFQGVYRPDLYLTPVRQWILDLPPRNDALLASRREWHFEQQVYREQVHGQSPDSRRHAELTSEAADYADTLQQSVFALCPSGSGPNTIRLWEALGYGAIPVILADGLRLPGDSALWQQAALHVPETPQAVSALPARLDALRADHARLAAMQEAGQQLWQRYGLPGFVDDIRTWQNDVDGFLLRAARQRLPADPELLQAEQPASLPLQLRQCLRRIPPEQPLLLQIADPSPLPLLETRWRVPLKMCAQLIAGRTWAIASRSPVLEQLVDPAAQPPGVHA